MHQKVRVLQDFRQKVFGFRKEVNVKSIGAICWYRCV